MSSFGTAADHAPPAEAKPNIRSKSGEILARTGYDKDQVVFREGSDGTDTYIVESGRIGIFKTTGGKPVRLAVLEKGAMFGEMAAITGEKRSATTMALEPSVVVRIPKSTMQSKMNSCDPFVKALLGILISNLSKVSERYVTTNNMAEKLLNELKAAQPIKPVEPAPPNEAEAIPADERKGPRGTDGGAPT